MKQMTTLVLTLALVAAMALGLQAETKTTVSGQVRLRNENDGKSFDNLATIKNFQILRTRVAIEATADDNAHAFIQLQDSRTLGGFDPATGVRQSGTTNDFQMIDMHQAYIQIDHLWANGIGVKAGRFEFNLGNQRVFGAVGWSNIARSWEGMQAWLGRDQFKITGFWLRRLELNDPNQNRDFDIFGFNAHCDRAHLDLFLAYEYDANNDHVFDPKDNDLDRINFGLYHKHQHNQWDIEINGVYQTGNKADPVTDSLMFDIKAYMFTAEVGYSFEGDRKARLAAGIDFTSGDDDPSAGDVKTYDNLYYTGHKFRGYMDYFVSSPTAGLMDLMLRGKVNPVTGWTFKGDLHYFKSAEDFASAVSGAPPTSDVGIEVDLTLATTRVSGVKLQGGLSVFLPDEGLVLNDDATVWGYTMATMNF